MATEVSICSNALLRLGADPISGFDEADVMGSNIERARLCANLWPTVRMAVLRSHSWNCATRRALISADATPPTFGFANRFPMPADWLRTLAVGHDEHDRITYRTEGRFWLSDESEFPVVYVYDNKVPASWDASLVNAMEVAMTAALAYPVTKSTSLAEALSGELRSTLQQARANDGQDDPAETLGDSPLYAARFGARRF
jgi:hypothetical protein